MYVSKIMTKPVHTISPDASVVDVARKLRDSEAGSLVVEMDTPVGIITETDVIDVVARDLDPTQTTAADIMSSNLITVDGFASVEHAVQVMRDNDIKKLPVIYGGALVGIVTTTDITYKLTDIVEGDTAESSEILKQLEELVS